MPTDGSEPAEVEGDGPIRNVHEVFCRRLFESAESLSCTDLDVSGVYPLLSPLHTLQLARIIILTLS